MPEPDHKPGLRLTGAPSLGIAAVLGLLVGWSLRGVMDRWGIDPPLVSLLQVVVFLAVGALLLLDARSMRRHRDQPNRGLTPSQAVNRLAMAKASAIGGMFLAAAYVGHAVSWVGSGSELTAERIVRALLAALGAAVVVIGGLVLERACRADFDDD